MTLYADSNGMLTGKFTIPANVQAGSKAVQINGSGGSVGLATFTGEGILVTDVLQAQNRVTQTFYDPVAQTFTLTSQYHIGGVDIYMKALGTTDITVQIRETSNGYPSQTILAHKTINPSALTLNAWNTFAFSDPFLAQPNTEYAIVVLCNDAVSAVGVATLGGWDTLNNRWVTQQPYQVGVLLTSSNASTWTASQDKDLSFRLLARKYTASSTVVNLGSVAVSGATDLVVNSMIDNTATGADGSLILTLPDGTNIEASDGQMVHLNAAITGNINVKATLNASTYASAVLYPGSQLVVGAISTTGTYISTAVNASASGCNVRVIFDGLLPSGSSVSVYYKGIDAGDTWIAMSQDPLNLPTNQGNGIYEYNYYATGITDAGIQIKLVLTGSPSARPFLYNLRTSIT